MARQHALDLLIGQLLKKLMLVMVLVDWILHLTLIIRQKIDNFLLIKLCKEVEINDPFDFSIVSAIIQKHIMQSQQKTQVQEHILCKTP